MSGRDESFWQLNHAGAVVLLATLIGGGTAQGLWTDHLLEIAMIPATMLGTLHLWNNRLSTGTRLLALAIIALILWQFLPFAPERALPAPPAGLETRQTWTLSPWRSFESGLYVLSVLGFFLFVARMEEREHIRLVRFLFLGLGINFLIAVVQLSYSGGTNVSGILPFEITQGLFANENHFADLVFLSVPLIAWWLLSAQRRLVAFILVAALMTAIMFAVDSRSGMMLTPALAVFSMVWFLLPAQRKWLLPAAVAIVAVFLFSGLASGLALFRGPAVDYREIFMATTLDAIRDHWLTGTGPGTFTLVYPSHENSSQVLDFYVNHAHNDYLEILLETGITGAALVAAFLVLVATGMMRSDLSQAAAIAISATLLHSLVDYPLRTLAIAIPFAMLSAIVLSSKQGENVKDTDR